MRIKKILVPVDFSEYAESALKYALFWAEAFSAELTLLHVNTLFHEHFDYDMLIERYREEIDQQERYIRKWMREQDLHVARSKVKLDFEVLRSRSAAGSILDFIPEGGYDLVVMGTHGRTGARHLFLGSVAEKVARLSPVPVFTTHKEIEVHGIRRILVPVDFSNFSKTLVASALEIGQAFDARVHLLHVLERLTVTSFRWMSENAWPYFKMDEDLRSRVTGMLRELPENPDDSRLVYEVVKAPHAYEAVVDYAGTQEVDLIIMGTRGFSKFDYFWLWGSTAERVLRLATCPVLTERVGVEETALQEA